MVDDDPVFHQDVREGSIRAGPARFNDDIGEQVWIVRGVTRAVAATGDNGWLSTPFRPLLVPVERTLQLLALFIC